MCVLLLPPVKSFVYQGSILFVPKFAKEIKTPPANAGDMGSITGSGRSPGVGNGNRLQYCCLGNPMDTAAWQVTVHGAAKEWDVTY